MASALVSLLPKRVYDFSGMSSGATQNYTITERVDISQFNDGIIILRVHSIVASGGTITFSLMPDGYTTEDPSLKFLTSTTLASTALNSTVVAPALQTASGSLLGHYALFRISGNRTSATALTATVSADLLMRGPDATLGM